MNDQKSTNTDHEFCLRCGRRLRNPDARMLGYGAVCYRKARTEKSRRLFTGGGNWEKEKPP